MLPSIEPSEVGITGLVWLFVSYGYVLFYAANLIGEGSELLLLVPSMAGLVGGVVLPLLGAVPDGAIILFSGLSPDLEIAQETLAIGVGALAGSTIMLLTIPLALSIIIGRVDLIQQQQQQQHDGAATTTTTTANYLGKPKLSAKKSFAQTFQSSGVAVSEAVQHGGILMALTSIPYFLIQIPASIMNFGNNNNNNNQEVGKAEHWWSFIGFVVCCIGLVMYMKKQLQISQEGQDRDRRVAVMKKILKEGKMSLSGIIASEIQLVEGCDENDGIELIRNNNGVVDVDDVEGGTRGGIGTSGIGGIGGSSTVAFQAIGTERLNSDSDYPSARVSELLSDLVSDAFKAYDENGDGSLDKQETAIFFRDFHETISDVEMNILFNRYDSDQSGTIDFHEFIGLSYSLIKSQERKSRTTSAATTTTTTTGTSTETTRERNQTAIAENAFSDVEEDEIPDEFTHLSPDEQQRAIKQRAFLMLLGGTVLVLIFSDPMVDVFAEIGTRTGISPFYVSFVLAPIASNASEVLSTMYYAGKKTRKTITVSLTALEGAACMNNTFCLSIFMALIFFRGIAWSYTAETIAIVIVEFIICYIVQRPTLTVWNATFILSIFPLSMVLVATLESLGFD